MKVSIDLTLEEFDEIEAALLSKAALVERGDYGEPDPEEGFDPQKWATDLETLAEKWAEHRPED